MQIYMVLKNFLLLIEFEIYLQMPCQNKHVYYENSMSNLDNTLIKLEKK